MSYVHTRHKVDANHGEVVDALRAAGADVVSLAAVSKGCPDLLVGFRGVNVLMEVKDGGKCPSARRLTMDEKAWHATWRGQVRVVHSPEEAVAALGLIVAETGETWAPAARAVRARVTDSASPRRGASNGDGREATGALVVAEAVTSDSPDTGHSSRERHQDRVAPAKRGS